MSLLKKVQQQIYVFKDILLLVVVFAVCNIWLRKLTEIININFKKTVLSEDADQFFEGSTYMLIPLALLIVLFFIKRSLLLTKWNDLESGKYLKLIVCTSVFSMAWAHSTYPFDYYLNELFWIERIGVVIIVFLVLWRPFFIFPFLLLPIMSHYGEPYLMGHWSIMELPTKVPLLFCSQLLIWTFTPKPKINSKAFIFLLICIVGSVYFPAGLAKLKQGWILNDKMHLLFINMYSDGWLGFLSKDTAVSITKLLAKSDLLLKLGAIIIELGCFLILVKKQFSIKFFIYGFITFHILVFILTGICFWPWVALEVAILIALSKKESFLNTIKGFSLGHAILACLLIITSSKWLKPSVFIWHDSPVNYTYKFVVEDSEENLSEIPSNYFWPKYYEFAWSDGFHFIHNYPTIDVNWGVTVNGRIVAELNKLNTKEQVLEYEKQKGVSFYNPELSNRFDRYLKKFIEEKKYKKTMNPFRRLLSAPQQRLVLFSGNNVYNGKKEVCKIHIYQHLTFYNETSFELIRNRKIKTIELCNN